MSEGIELRAVIASKQGLSCLGYYTLANRTKHLRERLYVSVRDGDKLFLPQGPEHFPVREIEAYYLGRMRFGVAQSIGEGGGEVVFSCEGSSVQAADEGATVITATLAGLDGVLDRDALSRYLAAVPEKSEGTPCRRGGFRTKKPTSWRRRDSPHRSGRGSGLRSQYRRVDKVDASFDSTTAVKPRSRAKTPPRTVVKLR